MRIGLVVYGSLSERSGGFRYDRRLVAALRDRGDDVAVRALPWRRYPLGVVDALDRGLRGLARHVDVLLADELCHPTLAPANRRLSRDAPLVAIVHHLRAAEPRGPVGTAVARRLERRFLSTVDAAVCASRATRSDVEALADVPRSIVAHPPGDRFDPSMDPDRIRERAAEPGPLRAVFLGNVIPRKGLHTLVEAVGRLAPDAVALEAIGRLDAAPGYARRVRRHVDGAGLADRVTLRGRLPDGAVAEALARAHVLAVPSTYEGFGTAYLDGMRFGLVPIATAAGGARELVSDGGTGFLVPPDDPGAVADRLSSFHDDRDRLAAMGIAARARAAEHPPWEETVDRIRDLLRDVVDGAGR